MKHDDTIIRRACAADTEALELLLQDPCVTMDGRDGSSPFGEASNDPQLPAHELCRGDIDTVLAEARQGLQGFLQLRWGGRTPCDDWMRGSVELKRHYVRARHRGAGVASRMLESAIDMARTRDAVCMWLKVRKDASQAVGFYRKHGFQVAGTALFRDGAQTRESWVMRRLLNARRNAGR